MCRLTALPDCIAFANLAAGLCGPYFSPSGGVVLYRRIRLVSNLAEGDGNELHLWPLLTAAAHCA